MPADAHLECNAAHSATLDSRAAAERSTKRSQALHFLPSVAITLTAHSMQSPASDSQQVRLELSDMAMVCIPEVADTLRQVQKPLSVVVLVCRGHVLSHSKHLIAHVCCNLHGSEVQRGLYMDASCCMTGCRLTKCCKTQVAGALLSHGPDVWELGWLAGGTAGNLRLAGLMVAAPLPAQITASAAPSLPAALPAHPLVTGDKIDLVGSPFGCIQPAVLQGTVRRGHVSNAVPLKQVCQAEQQSKETPACGECLLLVDVKALPGGMLSAC